MAKKNGFVLTGSVQEKNGKLYLVYPHYDPIKQVAKPKWKSMGLYEGEKKAVIEKKKRELLRELEAEERARLAGQNVAAVLELVKLGVELTTQHSDSADEPVEEPTLKM